MIDLNGLKLLCLLQIRELLGKYIKNKEIMAVGVCDLEIKMMTEKLIVFWWDGCNDVVDLKLWV